MMDEEQVDEWVKDNDQNDAFHLLDEKLPKMRAKLNRLDRRIREVLEEVQEEFPDACYYTASGGFNLLLGNTHDSSRSALPQTQRVAWSGQASIGDGDF